MNFEAPRPWITRLELEEKVAELAKTHEVVGDELAPLRGEPSAFDLYFHKDRIERHLRRKFRVGVPPPEWDPASVPPVSEKIKNTPGGYAMAYPLHAAAIRGTIRDVDAMLRSGKASLADRDGWGQTPLMAACSRYGSNSVKLVEWMLLRGGADPFAVNVAGLNARRYAFGDCSSGAFPNPDGSECYTGPPQLGDVDEGLDPRDEIYEDNYGHALGGLLDLPEDCPDSEFWQYFHSNPECQRTTSHDFVFGCRRAVYPLGLIGRGNTDLFMERTLLRHPNWLPVLLGPVASVAQPFCNNNIDMTNLWNEALGPRLRRAFLQVRAGFGVINEEVIDGWRDDDDDEEDVTRFWMKRPENEEHDWLDPTDSDLSRGGEGSEDEDGEDGNEEEDEDGDEGWKDVDEDEGEMSDAIMKGDLDRVRELIAEGWDLTEEDRDNYTPLHTACEADNSDIVAFLISAGSDVNQQCSDDGSSPLHVACRSGNSEAAAMLIEAGADKDLKTFDGESPLSLAIEDEALEIVEALLRAGVKRAGIDVEGRSAEGFLEHLSEIDAIDQRVIAEVRRLLRTIPPVVGGKKKKGKGVQVTREEAHAEVAEAQTQQQSGPVTNADDAGDFLVAFWLIVLRLWAFVSARVQAEWDQLFSQRPAQAPSPEANASAGKGKGKEKGKRD
jgi:hypothetical protein